MKHLIVSGDDFGYTRGINRAILAAHRCGILTSASLLANGAAFEDAVEQARLAPSLDIGCHVNLAEGIPVAPACQIPRLVRANGKFHGALGLGLRLLRGAVPAVEIERECVAQVEKLLRAGIAVSHLDTHRHTHSHPRVAGALARAARQFGIRWIRRPFENGAPPGGKAVRSRRIAGVLLNCFASRFERCIAAGGLCAPDFFTGFILTGQWTKELLAETLGALRPGVTELMCHPGYCDAALESSPTRLKREREIELEAVADGSLRAKIRDWEIVLTGFRELPGQPGGTAEELWLAPPTPASGE